MAKIQRAPQSVHGAYEADYAAWLDNQAKLLRAGKVQAIDADHLAEEIEDMGRSERRSLESHLKVLLQHLVKWHYQSERRGPSWRMSIDNARDAIEDLLAGSPSLRPVLAKAVAQQYRRARRDALQETGLASAAVPQGCPFALETILDSDLP